MNTAINQDLLVKSTNNSLNLPGEYVQVFHHLTYLKVINELKAPKGHTNEFGGGYKYRSAEDIQEALKPILLKHKCTVITRKFDFEGGFEIYAYMVFKDNTYIVCEVPGVAEYDFDRDLASNKKVSKTQQYAAYQSYAKKYALGNLLQIDDSQNDLDTHTNENIQKERTQKHQNNQTVTQADCDRALKQIDDLPLDTTLDQAVKVFDRIIASLPVFYDVLNTACCKKYAEIEQHLCSIQNAQQNTTATFNNGSNTSQQSKNAIDTAKSQPAVQQQNQVQAATNNSVAVQQQKKVQEALITSKQYGELEVFIDQRGLRVKDVCNYFAIDSLKQIRAVDLDSVKADIEKMAHEELQQ